MNHEKLSKRLQAVADFVPDNARLLDVGSDHAYLPINLIRTGKINFAVAGEVVKGPFESAVDNVRVSNLTDKITVRLANGLVAMTADDAINTVTIAGMGGNLIAEILAADTAKLEKVETLILQPNNGEKFLRTWLVANGFSISDERILSEHDKIYELMRVRHAKNTNANLTSDELTFGKYLMNEKSAVFKAKWRAEQLNMQKILDKLPAAAAEKRQMFQEKIEKIEAILNASK
ncbi:tRNA (adenine(22)-N(1))-methyltransferase [Lactococcus insecticola]|uniref:SAM-dependent methyltransferase n=1 Tax=Pseudolactococcus insecticola TaxID=2709158 RepID=A0A6A0B500_9LACT|nr:tRNA (adenine(22)-N(1))-methyltransferase TrmK [Lactococcus insecticola]GFH40282.1 SAM-dependent methyltransferase [Lactococcus insecticola]